MTRIRHADLYTTLNGRSTNQRANGDDACRAIANDVSVAILWNMPPTSWCPRRLEKLS